MQEAFRVERDALGELRVPAEAYYGIETMRARENFPISGQRLPRPMVQAVATIKLAAAKVHRELGALDAARADAIMQAAREVRDGRFDHQFVVDVYQAGAGTSFHMNANEVIANRAIEIMGGQKGDYRVVSPHDHVNMGQSTNDVFPTAMRLATLMKLPSLKWALEALATSLEANGTLFASFVKTGRTHLQDALPVTLGQEFGAYAKAVRRGLSTLTATEGGLLELGIGGTAVGTGLNTYPEFRFGVGAA